MDPDAKYCAGPCGRYLPNEAFYMNGHGHRNGRCKACHRVEARESYRTAYRNRPAFARREKRRQRERYMRDAAYHARRIQQCNDYRRAQKLKGAAS